MLVCFFEHGPAWTMGLILMQVILVVHLSLLGHLGLILTFKIHIYKCLLLTQDSLDHPWYLSGWVHFGRRSDLIVTTI